MKRLCILLTFILTVSVIHAEDITIKYEGKWKVFEMVDNQAVPYGVAKIYKNTFTFWYDKTKIDYMYTPNADFSEIKLGIHFMTRSIYSVRVISINEMYWYPQDDQSVFYKLVRIK